LNHHRAGCLAVTGEQRPAKPDIPLYENQILTFNMFKVRANFSETFEVKANLEKVREFFADIRNFVDLMPGIESIHLDSKGVMHWQLKADIPFVGSFSERFLVRVAENNEERVEWAPVEKEKYNLLRYAADFLPKSAEKTLVQFSQNIELRRNSATDLHLLAGLVGESLIGKEMTRRFAAILNDFLEKSRVILES